MTFVDAKPAWQSDWLRERMLSAYIEILFYVHVIVLFLRDMFGILTYF